MKKFNETFYAHSKRVCKDFGTTNLGEYHDVFVQSNTLLLADVFQNFRNMCLEIYDIDPAKFLSSPELAWQAPLKKTKIKLERDVINGRKKYQRRNIYSILECK